MCKQLFIGHQQDAHHTCCPGGEHGEEGRPEDTQVNRLSSQQSSVGVSSVCEGSGSSLSLPVIGEKQVHLFLAEKRLGR